MEQAEGGRITVVRWDGKVLVDSEANASEMENHRTRPELVQAFRGEVGSSVRHRATIGVPCLYVAVPGGRPAGPGEKPPGRTGGVRNSLIDPLLKLARPVG